MTRDSFVGETESSEGTLRHVGDGSINLFLIDGILFSCGGIVDLSAIVE